MKPISYISISLLFILCSCATVRVASDFDEEVTFSKYKSFAFYKPGIDKAEISDLDKKRILRAIEANLILKGFTKSETPDILINIFTKTEENINVFQNNWGVAGWYGPGWGWNPWFWGPNFNTVSRVTEGTLYIDLIDAEKKELVWQGMGTSALTNYREKKQEKINEIVSAIMKTYPPEKKQ